MALDQQALNLAKAIRKAETGTSTDPYNAKGASGESGAYQFMPETWKGWSKQYLGQENAPLSIENQNKVAYSRILELKNKGLSPAQIASAWNSGNPDAYKQNKVGTNSQGVAYDVPTYVKKVSENYNALKPKQAPQLPPKSPVVPPTPEKRPTINPYQDTPVLGPLTNFGIGVGSAIGKTVFGAAEAGAKLVGAKGAAEKIKGAKENLYDKQFGGSLDTMSGKAGTVVGNIAPYVASAGAVNAATKALPYGARVVARTLPDIAIGAAQTGGDVQGTAGIGFVSGVSNALVPGAAGAIKQIGAGYGVDVAAGLTGQRGEDRTGSNAFIPGLGTAIGTGIPVLSKLGNIAKNIGNEDLQFNKAVTKVEKKLAGIEGGTKSSRNKIDFNKDSRNRIARSNVLENAVDENGLINTQGAAQKYQDEVLNKNEGVVRADLEREGASIPAEVVRKKLVDKVNSSKLAGKEKAAALRNVDAEMKGIMLEADASGKIPLIALHDAKIIKASGVNWATDPFVGSERKALAGAYKELVEEGSSLPIGEINKELAKYYKDLDYLKLLDGKRVAGGRLGKYFAQISGNIVGGATGGAIGGPAGFAVGSVVGGELSGKINGILKKGTLTGIKGGIFPSTPVINEAVKRSKSPRLGLPAPTTPFRSVQTSGKTINLPARSQSTIDTAQSKSEGSLKKQYAATNSTNINAIPKSVAPAETKAKSVIPKSTYPRLSALALRPKFEQAMSELQALTDIAEAGSRNFASYGKDKVASANKSTFPKWIPEELRSKKLMQKVIDTIESGNQPLKSATRERKLYNEFLDYIEKQVSTPEELSMMNTQGGYVQIPTGADLKKFIGKLTPSKAFTIVAGLAAMNRIVSDKMTELEKKTYEEGLLKLITPPKANANAESDIDMGKTLKTIRHLESRGESDPYNFNRDSGQKKQGKALGAYQVTEGELATYSKKYLGAQISPEQFNKSQELQDKYMTNKVNRMINEYDMSLEEILAVHRGGITYPEQALKKYAQYVKEGIIEYNK